MNIVTSFCQTYDTKYLDKLSNELKLFIIKKAKESIITNKGFVGLSQIIINHFSKNNLTILSYKYLEGCISLSEHYSKKYKKHIYIFGYNNTHNTSLKNKDGITNIFNFIKQIITTSDKFIDFFLETTYQRTNQKFIANMMEEGRTNDFLHQTIKYYRNCFLVDKTTCPYKNTRFHYVDIRSNEENEFLTDINLEKLTLRFLSTNDKSERNKIYLKMLEDYKILKQIDNCPKEIEQIMLKDMIKQIEYIDKIKNMTNKVIYFQMYLLMDMYLIGRLFRTFTQKQNIYSGECKNVIIYANNDSAIHYRKILQDAEFYLIDVVNNNEAQNNFINIKQIQQPFFNIKV